MEIRDYEALQKRLCKHIEEIANHKSFDMGDIEALDKILHSINQIDKKISFETGSYSYGNGMWSAEGSYGRGNNMMYRDNSYGNRAGSHYVRGHYSMGEDTESEIKRMISDPNTSQNDKVILERSLEIMRR